MGRQRKVSQNLKQEKNGIILFLITFHRNNNIIIISIGGLKGLSGV